MQFIEVHENSEDFELHSKANTLKNTKRTLIDQNPHFKRSMISSMIRSTSEHYPGSITGNSPNRLENVQASNDQDRMT